jgi:hypothetical protein
VQGGNCDISLFLAFSSQTPGQLPSRKKRYFRRDNCHTECDTKAAETRTASLELPTVRRPTKGNNILDRHR